MKKMICIMLILALMLIVTSCKSETSSTEPNGNDPSSESGSIQIADLMPSAPLLLKYSGGYENAGSVMLYHNFNNGKYDVKHINAGMAGVSVYQIIDNILYHVLTDELDYGDMFNQDFSNTNVSPSSILLISPIEVGTSWELNEYGSTYYYEITSTDFPLSIGAGDFSAVEVTMTGDGYTLKTYYVEGLGRVMSNFEDMFIDELIEIIEIDLSLVEDVFTLLEDAFMSIQPQLWD